MRRECATRQGYSSREEQWKTFRNKHRHLPCYVPEDNKTTAGSYLLLNESMRLLGKGDEPMKKSDLLLSVGVKEAMKQVIWDKGSFDMRGGIYEWQRPQMARGAEEVRDGPGNKGLE